MEPMDGSNAVCDLISQKQGPLLSKTGAVPVASEINIFQRQRTGCPRQIFCLIYSALVFDTTSPSAGAIA